jgi:hypothetical protein
MVRKREETGVHNQEVETNMMTYRDMCFCTEETCKNFDNGCHRSLTEKVKRDAEDFGLPVAMFMNKPECYEEDDKDN